jgi:predicted permease
LDEEVRFHIEHQTEKNLQAGMSQDEAYRQAMIKFGGMERAKEETRDQFRFSSIENFLRDLRYAGRALRRAPGFTIVVIITLAISIGATTAMFSIVNGIVLRPLPYPEQNRLVEIAHQAPGFNIPRLFASPAVYFAYRDYSETFESIGLWDWDDSPVTVSGSGDPESVQSVEVTHEVLRILGVNPIVGRTFNQADDLPESAPTVIISYEYWKRHFGETNPLGRTLIIDGIPREVIGVLPEWFKFFDYPADIFYPRQPIRSEAAFPSFDGRAIALLKPGVTLKQANADVERIIPILNKEFGSAGLTWIEDGKFKPNLEFLKDMVVGNLDQTLWILMGTILLLLLIACANVSNLVLVRVQTRQSELAIRKALGANSADIARVVLTESTILGFVGGVAGVIVAYFSLPMLLLLGGTDLPQVMTVKIDPVILIAALAITMLATFSFAFVPVIHFALHHRQLADELQGSGRSITQGQRVNWVRHFLLLIQVAMAVLLLIGSGLMIQTFIRLRQVDPGFRDPKSVLTFQLTIPTANLSDADEATVSNRILRQQHAIVDRLAAVAGVQSAAFSAYNDGLPLDGDGKTAGFCAQGKNQVECASSLKELQYVSPDFFETLTTPLIAGRDFEWSDIHEERSVVLLSENLAREQYGSATAALGKRVGPDQEGPWFEVVGVVKDVHHNGLSEPAPQVLIYPAVARDTASFLVRSSRVGTSGFLEELRKAVWSVNANLSLANNQTLADLYQRSIARTTMMLQLLTITGIMALVLGLLGIYGMVSYAISQRRREIGIRLALGAEQQQIRRMFVQRALGVVAFGVVIGLALAIALTRFMESQLFGVTPLDPLTQLAVAMLVVVTAASASYISALRASMLNPVEVLKTT